MKNKKISVEIPEDIAVHLKAYARDAGKSEDLVVSVALFKYFGGPFGCGFESGARLNNQFKSPS